MITTGGSPRENGSFFSSDDFLEGLVTSGPGIIIAGRGLVFTRISHRVCAAGAG